VAVLERSHRLLSQFNGDHKLDLPDFVGHGNFGKRPTEPLKVTDYTDLPIPEEDQPWLIRVT
jgi:hypothetical protein